MLEGGKCDGDKGGRRDRKHVCRRRQDGILDSVVREGLTEKVASG